MQHTFGVAPLLLGALLALPAASGSAAAPETTGTAGASTSERGWSARNRERAKAGLLPRKPPSRSATMRTIPVPAPTAVPLDATPRAQERAIVETTAPVPAAPLRAGLGELRVGMTAVTVDSVIRTTPVPTPARTLSPGLLSQTWTVVGSTLQRSLDEHGRISHRTVDRSGRVVADGVVSHVTDLPLVSQRRAPDGGILQVVRDVSGVLIQVTRDAGGHFIEARVLDPGRAGA